uniref:Uncharacterized protein n=1 Tax=Alexandrium catenella TaxID=2925 RepID=A0A7S1L6U4_ALECA
MDAASTEAVLRKTLSPKVRIPPEMLTYLAAVLSELNREELEDLQQVRLVLEPFLLDFLKDGRTRPGDKKSALKVESLCQDVAQQLAAALDGASPEQRQSPAGPEVGVPPAAAVVARARTAVRDTLASFDPRVPLSNDAVDQIAAALSEMSEAELADSRQLAVLLEPLLLDAFHDCGEWAASEDADRLHSFSCALSGRLRGSP